MQVAHLLATVGAGVDDHAVPVRESRSGRYLGAAGHDLTHQTRVGPNRLVEVGEVGFGDDQDVGR